MRNISTEISRPNTSEGFEHFCSDVYAEVFRAMLPSRNGRRGQPQHGVDIFFDQIGGNRIAVQCKRYVLTSLTPKMLTDELAALDYGGARVDLFVLATTAFNDEGILRLAQSLSDERTKVGKCAVHIDFWDDLCGYIFRHSTLQRDYAPNSVGGIFEEFRDFHADALTRTTRIETILQELLESHRERQKILDVPPEKIRDEHGRYLMKATRTYVLDKPIMNLRKISLISPSILIVGLGMFFCVGLAPILKLRLPFGLFVIGLGVALVGAFLTTTCGQLRRRGITYALFLNRELLLEADHTGKVFVTRMRAICPFCTREMRYRFLGDWRRAVELMMVCDRNPNHSIDFDYTSMDEPGTDTK